MTNPQFAIEPIDLIEIERRARAMQSQAFADMFRALRASIAARLHLTPVSHTA
jgi:hypothetical protein